ncbi:hypothetical protein N8D56_27155 (plasmid) [Devosia sp. A8/3-2]|nr:hypothetical protein N8D56_27155 [Devosia sp. A8/3-2]
MITTRPKSSAQQKGSSALNIVVQFALAAVLPSIAQLTLAPGLLSTVVDIDIALIVFGYGVVYVALVSRAASVTRPHLDEAIEQSRASSRFVGNAISSMDTLRQFQSDRWMIGQFTNRERTVLEAFGRYAMTQCAMPSSSALRSPRSSRSPFGCSFRASFPAN